ncbi:MAG: helix-turn-helix transcriptional regulator [Eggerthellaceae bacterium]|nr:helix-turn-helix transcriptional regulator [Eggerthellaceae bacterium]
MEEQPARSAQSEGAQSEGGLLFVLALVVGSASFCTLAAQLFLSEAMLFEGDGTLVSLIDSRFLLLLTATVAIYVFSFRRPAFWLYGVRSSIGLNALLLAGLLLLPILRLISLNVALPYGLINLAWLVCGFAVGILLICWGAAWAAFYRETLGSKVYPALFGTSILIVFLNFSILYTPTLVSLSVLVVVSLAGAAGLWMTHRYEQKDDVEVFCNIKEHRMPFRAITHVAALGMYFGYCVAKSLVTLGFTSTLFIVLPAFFLASILILVVSRVVRQPLSFTLAGRIAFPVSIAGAFFIWLPPAQAGMPLQLFFAVVGCCFFMIYHWTFVCHWSMRYKVLPLAQAAFGIIAPLSGTLAGWGLMSLLVAFGYHSVLVDLILALLFLFCYVLVTAIMPYGSELRILDAERPVEDIHNETSSIWNTSLLHLSNIYGLTHREQEIFSYLARGRNIGYISTALFISTHTVKTHVYRIYSKLGINSQQDLITMVENCVAELKKLQKTS